MIAIRYLLALVLGAVIGILSAAWVSGLIPGMKAFATRNVDIEGWGGNLSVGKDSANPWVRAWVARHGLLALAREEAVYFTRSVDDAGLPLTERCRYRMEGGAQPARWWSVTLYDAKSRLPMNEDAALSVDATTAGRGNWRAIIAAERPAGSEMWISSRNGDRFDLTLRLYQPEADVPTAPATSVKPPRIERLDCREGA
ncbi:MAG: DUF1214 domain-containing protein [Pacificimonas sp.]